MEPPYDVHIPLWEVAGRYCPTARDTYLRHVERVRLPPTPSMVRGRIYHQAVAQVISVAKTYLYREGICQGTDLNQYLRQELDGQLEKIFVEAEQQIATSGMPPHQLEEVKSNTRRLWLYQAGQIAAQVDRVLAKHPYIGVDSLVHTAIPVVVEQKLDGRHLGLSGQLSADAFTFEPLILDLKTATPMPFHRLTTTGYALVYESITETPIDVGCIIYVNFTPRLPVPYITWDEHLIDEPLRQQARHDSAHHSGRGRPWAPTHLLPQMPLPPDMSASQTAPSITRNSETIQAKSAKGQPS